MKRREFIRKSSAVGLSGLIGQGCATPLRNMGRATRPGFDIHPFVKAHPGAVFVVRTAVKSKKDEGAINGEGAKLANQLIVPTESGGFPDSTLVTIKHNWHGIQTVDDLMPENTDPNFIEGWIQGMQSAGLWKFYANSSQDLDRVFKKVNLRMMGELYGVDVNDYNDDYWKLPKGAVIYRKVPDSVVFDTFGHSSPYGRPGTFLVNLAKFKAHSMGITAAIKNLQGLCPGMFRRFCTPYDQVRNSFGSSYGRFLRKNFENDIVRLHEEHVRAGIPRWDKPADGNGGYRGGIWQEQWVQRMLDSLSVSPQGLHIVEGIYGMDGNGFGAGPHEKSANGYTSRDFMSNVIIFGLDPFRVDIITHWMAGHEPGNFGLFHIGVERGFSDVLDPNDIPVYFWKDGEATLTSLENLPRTPLKTLYLQRDYAGQDEPTYHLCNEPFDYAAWKAGRRTGKFEPSRSKSGFGAGGAISGQRHVYVDILDRNGRKIGELLADGELEPGTHQVVWDGFDQPGLYNAYFKGMGWDPEKHVVTYS